MRDYYPEFHTPVSLAAQIEDLYAHYPEMLVVGSLGRAAVYRNLLSNSFYEFNQRDQHPLHTATTARDVDVIGAEHSVAAKTLPYWIDATSYDIDGTQIAQEGGDWLISVDGRYEAPLHPAVMEPIEAETIYGIPCITLPAETQLALLRVRGKFREKDLQTFSLLAEVIEREPLSRRLPADLLAPFEEAHQVNIARMDRLLK